MSVSALSFDAVDERGTGFYTLVFFTGLGSAACGLVMLFFSSAVQVWVGPATAVLGIGAAIWAFRALPQTKYYTYFVLDEFGLHYRNSPEVSESIIPWNRILGVKALDPQAEEFVGIELEIVSTRGFTDALRIPMHFGYEIEQAVRAIRTALTSDASPNHALEGGRPKAGAIQRER